MLTNATPFDSNAKAISREWLAFIGRHIPKRAGTRVFGAAAVTLGLIGLYRGDFTIVWHPVPDGLYARTELAYACALLFLLGGAGVQFNRTVAVASYTLCALYAMLSIGWIVRVITYPSLIGTWLGVAEQLALATGALAVICASRPHPHVLVMGCRVAFGVFEIVFALGHFLSLRETVALTPSWLPPGPTFWALTTGAAHLIGGIALILNVVPQLAARGLALMFAIFGLLVWVPQLFAHPGAAVPWAGNGINLALVGAALALGDMLAVASISRREASVRTGNGLFKAKVDQASCSAAE